MIYKWSNFTINNIIHFKNNKYILSKDNYLLNFIKNEFTQIKLFIINNELKINYNKNNNFNKNILKKLCNSEWVDKYNLVKEIDNLKNIYEFTWNSNKIIINLNELSNIIIDKIKIIIYILEYIRSKTNKKINILIYLIFSNLEKKFPINDYINTHHINSGYTDHNRNLILVWRYEEFEKVIFHEIIHLFDLDKYDLLNFELFKINGPHSYFEVITDFYAIIYHIIFISLLTKLRIKTLLEIELAFIKNQALYLNNYFKLDKWTDIPNKIINQKTPAFSYYILKYILFEYTLYNKFDKIDDYKKIFKLGITTDINKYININSGRMTLFSLE